MACTELPGSVATACHTTATVVENRFWATNTYRLRLECPEIASQILPGQFLMVRPVDGADPLLGRPFALLDIVRNRNGEATALDLGYVVVGKLTSLLAHARPGDKLSVWGPLGNGFPEWADAAGQHLAIVAGGIGQTPFVPVMRELLGLSRYGRGERDVPSQRPRITMSYGVRSGSYFAGLDELSLPGVTLQLSTDDGSVGHRGFVTDLLASQIQRGERPDRIYCCGPEPLMRAVRKIALAASIPTWLSLETPMACGFGACFSCVTPFIQDDGSHDYRRVCVEGPVFPADRVLPDPA